MLKMILLSIVFIVASNRIHRRVIGLSCLPSTPPTIKRETHLMWILFYLVVMIVAVCISGLSILQIVGAFVMSLIFWIILYLFLVVEAYIFYRGDL